MPKCCTILFLFFEINLKSGQLSDRSAGWCCWFNVVGIVIIPIRSKKKNEKTNFSVEFLRSILKVVCSCHLVDDAIRCQSQLIFTQIRKKKKNENCGSAKKENDTNHFKRSLDISLLSNTHSQIKIWFVCFVWQFFGEWRNCQVFFFFFLLLKWDIQLSSRWCGCCYF